MSMRPPVAHVKGNLGNIVPADTAPHLRAPDRIQASALDPDELASTRGAARKPDADRGMVC